MATFKPTIRAKREDGTRIVYIRCTHNRKVEYIRTNWYVHSNQYKDNEITDDEVKGNCYIKIKEYIKKLNSVYSHQTSPLVPMQSAPL